MSYKAFLCNDLRVMGGSAEMWQFLSTSSADSVWAPTVLFNFKVDKTSFVAVLNDVLHNNLKLSSDLVPY